MKAWLRSVASIFDFAGTFRDPRIDEILSRSDAEAIRSDWQAVGEDIHCAIHSKRRSEHDCRYCCLCFRTLTPDECHVLPDGQRENVCEPCAAMEAEHGD